MYWSDENCSSSRCFPWCFDGDSGKCCLNFGSKYIKALIQYQKLLLCCRQCLWLLVHVSERGLHQRRVGASCAPQPYLETHCPGICPSTNVSNVLNRHPEMFWTLLRELSFASQVRGGLSQNIASAALQLNRCVLGLKSSFTYRRGNLMHDLLWKYVCWHSSRLYAFPNISLYYTVHRWLVARRLSNTFKCADDTMISVYLA